MKSRVLTLRYLPPHNGPSEGSNKKNMNIHISPVKTAKTKILCLLLGKSEYQGLGISLEDALPIAKSTPIDPRLEHLLAKLDHMHRSHVRASFACQRTIPLGPEQPVRSTLDRIVVNLEQ